MLWAGWSPPCLLYPPPSHAALGRRLQGTEELPLAPAHPPLLSPLHTLSPQEPSCRPGSSWVLLLCTGALSQEAGVPPRKAMLAIPSQYAENISVL